MRGGLFETSCMRIGSSCSPHEFFFSKLKFPSSKCLCSPHIVSNDHAVHLSLHPNKCTAKQNRHRHVTKILGMNIPFKTSVPYPCRFSPFPAVVRFVSAQEDIPKEALMGGTTCFLATACTIVHDILPARDRDRENLEVQYCSSLYHSNYRCEDRGGRGRGIGIPAN